MITEMRPDLTRVCSGVLFVVLCSTVLVSLATGFRAKLVFSPKETTVNSCLGVLIAVR